MYPTPLGLKYFVQQKISGTGTFDGTEYGRARRTVDSGVGANGIIAYAAKQLGTVGNALTIQYIDIGAGLTQAATQITQTGPVIKVILRRSSGALLATATEVAAAINAAATNLDPAYAIRARVTGTGSSVVAATSALAFTGGADPTIDRNQYFWNVPTNGNGGFFHFEQEYPIWLLGVSGNFNVVYDGEVTLNVDRVRLNDDFTLQGESYSFFKYPCLTPNDGRISYTDVKQLVHPGQAIRVTLSVATAGYIGFDVMRAAEFPYA